MLYEKEINRDYIKTISRLYQDYIETISISIYRDYITWDVGRTLEEFVNHSPAARDLQILLVFYQHPAWFISL